jgi:molybdopterin-synthase adenylyltransferase
MLSDSQIDRYSRQIVLPEIGSRGQERLLAARVAVRGGGDAALVCASYLSGAGVGSLGMDDLGGSGPVGGALGFSGVGLRTLAAAIAARNPDCRLSAESPLAPNVVVLIGAAIPDELPLGSAVVWGAADAESVVRVHFPAGTACAPCLKAASLLANAGEGESPVVLGSLLAVDCLRILLGLARDTRPSVLRLVRTRSSSFALPARDDCVRCRSH